MILKAESESDEEIENSKLDQNMIMKKKQKKQELRRRELLLAK